jgi:hypothetical protein
VTEKDPSCSARLNLLRHSTAHHKYTNQTTNRTEICVTMTTLTSHHARPSCVMWLWMLARSVAPLVRSLHFMTELCVLFAPILQNHNITHTNQINNTKHTHLLDRTTEQTTCSEVPDLCCVLKVRCRAPTDETTCCSDRTSTHAHGFPTRTRTITCDSVSSAPLTSTVHGGHGDDHGGLGHNRIRASARRMRRVPSKYTKDVSKLTKSCVDDITLTSQDNCIVCVIVSWALLTASLTAPLNH